MHRLRGVECCYDEVTESRASSSVSKRDPAMMSACYLSTCCVVENVGLGQTHVIYTRHIHVAIVVKVK